MNVVGRGLSIKGSSELRRLDDYCCLVIRDATVQNKMSFISCHSSVAVKFCAMQCCSVHVIATDIEGE